MLWESALSSCIEIAIGLAGFAGIIAVLKSGTSSLDQEDRVRLEILLGASGSAMFFSLLPLIALDYFSTDRGWSILSAAYACFFFLIAVFRFIQVVRGSLSRIIAIRMSIFGIIAGGLLASNVIWIQSYWVYLAMIVVQLAAAFFSFVMLLLGILNWQDRSRAPLS